MSQAFRRTPDATLQARFRGCLVGGAVGDALGAPVEFMSRAEIVAHARALKRSLPHHGFVFPRNAPTEAHYAAGSNSTSSAPSPTWSPGA